MRNTSKASSPSSSCKGRFEKPHLRSSKAQCKDFIQSPILLPCSHPHFTKLPIHLDLGFTSSSLFDWRPPHNSDKPPHTSSTSHSLGVVHLASPRRTAYISLSRRTVNSNLTFCLLLASSVTDDDLYWELWKLCAGPFVDVPVAASSIYISGIETGNSHFNLPSKILCGVVNIQLLAEQETDEVYACIALLPESNQTEPVDPDPNPPESPKHKLHSFCKILTASDTSTHGGFSVLWKHATECFPLLDMTQATPTQESAAKDLHG